MIKMILFRKFRVFILMVFLVACTMHIMIDLLPKLEKRAVGSESADGGGCQCAHGGGHPGEDTGQQHRAKQQQQQGWPNKHALRILQDFGSEPNSNLSSRSAPSAAAAAAAAATAAAAEGAEGAPFAHARRDDDDDDDTAGDPLIGGASLTAEGTVAGASSRLLALFEHPLYRIDLPTLTDEDTLFNVNTDIRFYPRAAGNQGCPALGALLRDLATLKITSVAMKSGGTQLKLIMTFQNYGQALFKPMK
ncbi:hypothetical protein NHX12_031723 [Muraenolepis orangiensis]|uniref:Uncharacterized protein n=1 Tax=Muraenolepis orangiensis TaxID=630683 RepID=A0A9Q0IJY3_9TELE|nr:hypothetical protein NHX12_031723 [Muraenolepis orangiensis]